MLCVKGTSTQARTHMLQKHTQKHLLHTLIQLALDGEIVMRNGGLALCETRGNDAANVGVRHIHVLIACEQSRKH